MWLEASTVIVADAEVRLLIVALEMVVVARLVIAVAVRLPVVRELKLALLPERVCAYRLVDVLLSITPWLAYRKLDEAFVNSALADVRSVKNPVAAVRSVVNRFVVVALSIIPSTAYSSVVEEFTMFALVEVKLFAIKLSTVAFVVEELTASNKVAVAFVNEAFIELRLVEVEFVVLEFVATKLVDVAFVEVRLVTVPRVIVVVARVEVPRTVRVPFEVNDEVAVIDPPVKLLMVALIAEKKLEKKLVLVPLVEVSEVILVVAKVVVPRTISVPDAWILPSISEVNLVLSTHPDPPQ